MKVLEITSQEYWNLAKELLVDFDVKEKTEFGKRLTCHDSDGNKVCQVLYGPGANRYYKFVEE